MLHNVTNKGDYISLSILQNSQSHLSSRGCTLEYQEKKKKKKKKASLSSSEVMSPFSLMCQLPRQSPPGHSVQDCSVPSMSDFRFLDEAHI